MDYACDLPHMGGSKQVELCYQPPFTRDWWQKVVDPAPGKLHGSTITFELSTPADLSS